MLLVQVLVIILTTVPGQIVLIYQTLTSSESKNAYRMAQERFALQSGFPIVLRCGGGLKIRQKV